MLFLTDRSAGNLQFRDLCWYSVRKTVSFYTSSIVHNTMSVAGGRDVTTVANKTNKN